MAPHSSCYLRPLVGPLDLLEFSSDSCVAGPCRPSRVQGRRPSRVLYPPHLNRRPLSLKNEPDPARRWLVLLMLLVLLQIYSEDTGTELSSKPPNPAEPSAHEEEEFLKAPVVPLTQDGAGFRSAPVVPLTQDDQWRLYTLAVCPVSNLTRWIVR